MSDVKEVLEHSEKKPRFKVGDRVVSESFGAGTVTSITGADANNAYPVTVVFDYSVPPDYDKEQRFTSEGHYFLKPMDYVLRNMRPNGIDITLLKEESEEPKPVSSDSINPSHYRVEGIPEAIDIMRGLMTAEQIEGFLWGNIIKYAYRYGRKGDKKETAKKIEWYANRLAILYEAEQGKI